MLRLVLLLLAAFTPFEDPFQTGQTTENDGLSHLRAGLLALQGGDLALAQSNLEAASKLAPREGRVWVALSQTYWRLHQDRN